MIHNLGFRGTESYYAPEIIQKPQYYDPFKADIFTLGVLLHIMLERTYPYGNSAHIPNIGNMKKKISADCYDLLLQLLDPEPSNRPSIGTVLYHPWLRPHKRGKKERVRTAVKKKLPRFPSKSDLCKFIHPEKGKIDCTV